MEDFLFADNISVPEADFETKVPAEFRSYYAKGQDGTYTVADDHKATTGLFDGLRKNLTSTKKNLTAAQAESASRRQTLESLSAIVGTDKPDELKTKWDEIQTKLTSGNKDKINVEEVKAAIAAEYEPKIKAKDDEIAAMTASLSEHLIDGDAARALAEHKGNVTVLMPHIKNATKVIKTDEGKYVAVVVKPDGSPRVGADGGYVPVSKLVEELKANKDFAGNFAGNQNTGGGNQPHNHQQQQRQQVQRPNDGQKELRGVGKIAAATSR